MIRKYSFNTQEIGELKTLIKQRKIGFPYKRYNYSDDEIKEMFNNLENYRYEDRLVSADYSLKNILISDDMMLYEGDKHILLSDPEDYYNYNQLSDMFQEKNRIKASFKNNISPFNYFFRKTNFIIKDCAEKYSEITQHTLRETLYSHTKECSNHRPTNIMAMIQIFNSKCVLDFSSGWGDRLLGAMASDVEYVGVDPNEDLHYNYQQMISFFGKSSDKYIMLKGEFEHIDVPKKPFDLVYTSPPYYDMEIYTRKYPQSSDYKTEKEWENKFLIASVAKAWDALIDGGIFAININQNSRSQRYVKKMIEYLNNKKNSIYIGLISYSNKEMSNPQPIFIFKKNIITL